MSFKVILKSKLRKAETERRMTPAKVDIVNELKIEKERNRGIVISSNRSLERKFGKIKILLPVRSFFFWLEEPNKRSVDQRKWSDFPSLF